MKSHAVVATEIVVAVLLILLIAASALALIVTGKLLRWAWFWTGP